MGSHTSSVTTLPVNEFLALINANSPSATNPFVTVNDLLSGTTTPKVSTTIDLPVASTKPNQIYYVENSTGAKWRKILYGGTWEPAGLYYSNGVNWTTTDIPFQSSQAEVDAGVITDSFLTPATFNNASKWNTHTHTTNQVAGIRYPYFVQALTFSPTSSQTIFFGGFPRVPTSSLNRSKIYVEETTIITAANIYTFASTAGSNEAWAMFIRVNGTTDYLIKTVSTATNERIFNNPSMSVTVNGGEYYEIKLENPLWNTPPVSVVISGNIFVSTII